MKKSNNNIGEFILKFPDLPEKVIRGTITDLTSAIIKGTPVDTGRLRGNWMASINRASRKKTTKVDKGGDTTIAKAIEVLNRFKLGNVFYLSNNLPYVEKIEYGGSGQAPQGMVRINVNKAQRMINEHIRKYKT